MSPPRPRPDLASLQPYSSSGVTGGRIFLHANENPYPPPPDVIDEIYDAARLAPLNRYPDSEAGELRDELASYAGVEPEWVWVGDGSNEVLLQCCLAFGGPGRRALLFEPTYRMHHRQARMAGMEVMDLPRGPDFFIDTEAAVRKIEEERPHIVFLCTPNNPTGTLTPRPDLLRLADAAQDALVVVDEAYFEFSRQTLADELQRLVNVVVVRTLSKAFRLAAVRLGYGLAQPGLLEELRRVRMPYAQSAFTQVAATIAVRRRERLLDVVDKLVAERERVSRFLEGLDGVEVYPSAANFVFFRHPRHDQVLESMAGRGIVIRDFSHLEGCGGCLRVTAGTPGQNDEFLDVLASLSD